MQYNQSQKWLKWMNITNICIITIGFIGIIPMIFSTDLDATWYLATQILLQLQLFFSCGAMVYALNRLNKGIKEIQNILPKTCLLLGHAILLVLIVVTALVFYICQFAYYHKSCDTEPIPSERCTVTANLLELSNGLYTLVDALCYGLILYMTYKFLVPTEQLNVIEKQTSWLKVNSEVTIKDEDAKSVSTSSLSEVRMPAYLTVIN